MPDNTENVLHNDKDEKDLENIVTDESSDDSHIAEDVQPSKEGDRNALDGLILSYKKYYESKNNTNISLRKKYFNCSFALIFILVFGFIGTTIMVCLCVKDNLAIIISLVSSIGGLVPSVLILPRIIGRYIFPEDEYDGAKAAIEFAKKSNNNKKEST